MRSIASGVGVGRGEPLLLAANLDEGLLVAALVADVLAGGLFRWKSWWDKFTVSMSWKCARTPTSGLTAVFGHTVVASGGNRGGGGDGSKDGNTSNHVEKRLEKIKEGLKVGGLGLWYVAAGRALTLADEETSLTRPERPPLMLSRLWANRGQLLHRSPLDLCSKVSCDLAHASESALSGATAPRIAPCEKMYRGKKQMINDHRV